MSKRDPAARFIRTAKARKERDLAPTLKASAVRALIEAEIAGREDYPPATKESVRRMLVLSEQEIAMLNAITSGKPPRNAQAILAGIRLKLEYSMKKPQAEEAQDKKPVNVTITMLGGPAVHAAEVPYPPVEADKETVQ